MQSLASTEILKIAKKIDLFDIYPADDISYIAIDSIELDSFFEVKAGHTFLVEVKGFDCSDVPQRFKANYYNSDHLGNIRVKFHNELSFISK